MTKKKYRDQKICIKDLNASILIRLTKPPKQGGKAMNSQEGLILIDSLLPAVFGGSLLILAILGGKELLKETFVALKKQANA